MAEPRTFEYAVIRVVPRVERGEFVNAGVIVWCRTAQWLGAEVALDPARLRAIAPGADLPLIESHLEAVVRICRGGPDAGPIGQLAPAERFRWLVAPRSTVIQTSPVHEGLCEDPGAALADAMSRLVRTPGEGTP